MPAPERCCSALILGLAALAGAGCTVQRARTVPFDGRDNVGVVYSVPKTYLSITVQYAYTRDDLHPAMPEGHLQGALKIAPILVPDEKATFIVKSDGLMSNAMFLTSLNYRFNNGTLESVDAVSSDRTGQVIRELADTAVNIAKAAAKGDATPREKAILAAERRVEDIYAEIARVSALPLDAPRNGPTLESLTRELDTARKLIVDLRTNVDPPMRTVTAPLVVMVDPDKPTRSTGDYLEFEVAPPQLFADVPAENMDCIYVRIYDSNRRGFAEALHEGGRRADFEGIIYRQPVALLTKILAGPAEDEEERREVFSGMLNYAQFAAPSVAVLDAKMMTSKHTAVVLDTVNGGLVSYGNAQDSALVNAAAAANDISRAVVDAENAANPQPAGRGTTGTSRGGTTTGSRGGTTGASGGSGTTTRGSSGGTGSGGTTTQPSTRPTTQPSTGPTTNPGRGGRGSTTQP